LPHSVKGQLYVESREPVDLREASIGLISADPDLPSPRSVSPRADGQFALNGALPGSYILDITNLPGDLYLKAARFGAKDIFQEPVTFDSKALVDTLQVLLGADGGRLQAAAYNAKGELHPDAQLVLVPDVTRRNRRDQYRLVSSDDDGRAMFRGIPPGRYKLFAFETLEPNAYLNGDFIRVYDGFGVPLNISSGDNPPVSLRLIAKD
jgi:hypothetical protein